MNILTDIVTVARKIDGSPFDFHLKNAKGDIVGFTLDLATDDAITKWLFSPDVPEEGESIKYKVILSQKQDISSLQVQRVKIKTGDHFEDYDVKRYLLGYDRNGYLRWKFSVV